MKRFLISLISMAAAGGLFAPAAFADDIPLPPTNFKAVDGGDRYNFSWSKVGRTGKNGGTVDPNNVTYVVESLNEDYSVQVQVASTSGTAATFFYPTSVGEQDIKRFSIYARNAAGKSDVVYLRVVTGNPLCLPYYESFGAGDPHGLVWQEGDGGVYVATTASSDGDSGAILMAPDSKGGATSLCLNKLVLENTQNPRISIDVYGLAEGDKLNMRVMRPDAAEATMKAIEGPVDEWTTFTADLSKVKNQFYIIPKIQLAEGSKEMVYVDNVRVYDAYSTDLGLYMTLLDATAGQTAVKVVATNEGVEPCADASFVINVDGQFVSRHFIDGVLESGESQTFEIPVPVTGDAAYVEAVVDWNVDLNEYNDVTSLNIVPEGTVDNGSAGVDGIFDANTAAAIYTIDGRKVNAGSKEELAPGLYIINGKKVMIK